MGGRKSLNVPQSCRVKYSDVTKLPTTVYKIQTPLFPSLLVGGGRCRSGRVENLRLRAPSTGGSTDTDRLCRATNSTLLVLFHSFITTRGDLGWGGS